MSALPLSTETSCPRCQTTVTVRLVAAAASVEVAAVRFAPEYVAHHRCPDEFEDPWKGHPASDTSWAVPNPRSES